MAAPLTGDDLPVILFSHGHGMSNYLSSLYGYGPLVDFYAAHGFAVIQPTHLNSKAFGGDPTGPEGALFWRSRPQDLRTILDRLIELRETHGFKIRLLLQVDTLCHRIPNFIEKAARAGCNAVFIGLENINPQSLMGAKKRQN